MNPRRQLLQRAGAAALAGCALTPLLGGCGTRAPAPPPAPPRPLRRVLVLPPDWASQSESNTGFGVVPMPIYIHGSASRGSGHSSSSGVAAAVGVALLAGVIVWSITENRRREAQSVAEALAAVAFDPLRHLQERFAPALDARGVVLARLGDADQATRVRYGGLQAVGAAVPADVDAWLDLRVLQSGYYGSMRAGGFSPMLHLGLALRDPEGRELASFSYYADWRDGGGDRRWITTPRSMTYPSTAALRDDAAAVRAGLSELVDRFVALMAEDVQRHAAGLVRID